MVQIVQLKLSLYSSTSRPPSQSPVKSTGAMASELSEEEQAKKAEFLKSFLVASILPLWPDGWMQLSVLTSLSQGHKSLATNSQHKSQQFHKPQMNASLNMASPAASSPLARSNMSLNEGSLPNRLNSEGGGGGLKLVSKSGK